jgi:long-chain acyl-CoA synthetase
MLSNRNLCSDLFLVSENINLTPCDRSLSLLPLHHTYETIAFLMMLYCGCCIAFCGGVRYLSKSFQLFSPTVFVTVPLILEKLYERLIGEIEKKGMRQKFRLASFVSTAMSEDKKKKLFHDIHVLFGKRLETIIVGAAALQPSVAEDFELFGFKIIIGYGLTECSPIVICNSVDDRTTDTVGRPHDETEVKIDSPDEKGIGELLVKGPMVMLGYYKNKEATEEVLRNGWFCTGDLGRCDKNGRYRITGRCKNVIVTKNGKNIYPEELEYKLQKNPFIGESLVYAEKGDIVSCDVLPDLDAIKHKLKTDTPSDDDVKALINEAVRGINRHLPAYKRIKKVTVRKDGFPKTATHKIKRKY